MATKFVPRLNLTRALQRELDAAAARLARLEEREIPDDRELVLRREVAPDRAEATTRIEGYGEAGAPYTPDEIKAANRGALLAYEFVDYLAGVPEVPVNELAIREMNRLFLTDASPALTPGAYRRGQNRVGDFTPPNQGDVPERMREFASWIAEDELSSVARAAVAHLEFVALHPFWDGNGRTARGLASLVLQRAAPHAGALLPVEQALYEHRPAYFAAIQRSLGRMYRDGYDATPFVRFFAGAVASAAAALEKRLDESRARSREVALLGGAGGLSGRQALVLSSLSVGRRLTRADYLDITGVSPITATRDLNDLVKRGLLRVSGRTRDRFYTLP